MSIEIVKKPNGSAAEEVDGHNHIVHLGIYNADPFRFKIEKWLLDLYLSGTALVVSDNCSTNRSLDWLRMLLSKMRTPNSILENARNYGCYGNLAMKLNLSADAAWVTTIHQDDRYSRDYVQRHRSITSDKGLRVGIICSEARSIAPEGRLLTDPPRAMDLKRFKRSSNGFFRSFEESRIAILWCYFLNEVLQSFPIPWHSTAFPDSEIVMKMIVDFDVVFAPRVTVEYLENANSESHSLGEAHRDFSSFQSLISVFAHTNYRVLCDLVPRESTPKFLSALFANVSVRLEDRSLRGLMTQAILELTPQHLGTIAEMAQALVKGYAEPGDVRAVDILTALGAQRENLPRGCIGGLESLSVRVGQGFPATRSSYVQSNP